MSLKLDDLITASGKYPERKKSFELTPEVIANGEDLIKRVNALFNDLNIDVPKVSSGFRPSVVNSKIANAAKRSAHMIGKAIDLEDPKGELGQLVMLRPDLLKKHGLMLENPQFSKTWIHLDTVYRPPRSNQMFNP